MEFPIVAILFRIFAFNPYIDVQELIPRKQLRMKIKPWLFEADGNNAFVGSWPPCFVAGILYFCC